MRRARKSTVAVLVIALVLGLVGVGCTKKDKNSDQTPAPTKVTLATAKNIWCTLTFVALAKGYFEKEGLNVDAQYLQGGRYCLDAVMSGSADFGNIVEVNIAYVAFTGNENVAVVGTIAKSAASAIVARKSSGIMKAEDLRGKTLAICPGMTSDIFAHRYLKKYGLTTKDVNIINIQPLALQSTIVGHGADAVSTWEPFIYNIEKALGSDATVLADSSVYTGYENIAVRKDWAQRNKSLVEAFVRANMAAAEFVKANPEESQAIVAKAIELDLETVKAIWNEHDIRLTMDPNEMVSAVSAIGEWIRLTQPEYLGKPLPNYPMYFDDEYFKAIENEQKPR